MASNLSPGVMNKFVGNSDMCNGTARRSACVCACSTGAVIRVSCHPARAAARRTVIAFDRGTRRYCLVRAAASLASAAASLLLAAESLLLAAAFAESFAAAAA